MVEGSGGAGQAGSPINRRPLGSSLSLWASRENALEADGDEMGDLGWLDIKAGDIKGEDACKVAGSTGMEEAVEVSPSLHPWITQVATGESGRQLMR